MFGFLTIEHYFWIRKRSWFFLQSRQFPMCVDVYFALPQVLFLYWYILGDPGAVSRAESRLFPGPTDRPWLSEDEMSVNRTKTFAIEGRLSRKTNYDQSSPFKHFNSSTILLRANLLCVTSLMPHHRSSGSLCKRVLTWRLTKIVHRVRTLPRVLKNHREWKRSCPQFSGLSVSYS